MNRKAILSRIHAVNLKGRNLDFEPAVLTLLVGDNATGKTAVREAVLLALMGRHPEFGKQKKSIMQLAGEGPSMRCIVELTDDGRFESSWKRRGTDSSSTASDMRLELVDAQLDFGTFRRAKPTARQEILEELLGQEDKALDSEEREEARDFMAARDLDVSLEKGGDWLSALQRDCGELGLNAKHEADIARDALLELMGRAAPEDAPTAAQIQEAETQYEKATRAEAKTAQTLENLQERIDNAPARPAGDAPERAALDELDKQMEDLEARIDKSSSIEADWQRLSGRMETLQAQRGDGPAAEHDPAVSGDPPTDDALSEANEFAQEAERKAQSLAEQLEHIEQTFQREQDRLESVLSESRCPTCGAEGENLAAAVRAGIQKNEEAHETERAHIDAQYKKAQATAREGKKRFEDLTERAEKCEQARRWVIDRELGELQTQIDALADARAASASLVTERTQLRASQRDLRDQLKQWDAWRAAAPPDEQELEKARAAQAEAEQHKNAAGETREALQQRADEVAAARDNKRREQRLKKDREKHEHDMKAYRQVATWAKKRKQKRAADRMAKLLQPTNRILKGLELGELAIDGTTIGIMPEDAQTDDALRPLEVLSGSETTAVATAIQVAIASQASLRLVIVDELHHFSPSRKELFLSNLRGAVDDGIIDQAIVLDYDQQLTPKGWTRFDVDDVVQTTQQSGAR